MKRLIIVILALGLLAIGGAGAWIYSDLHRPITHSKTGRYVEIPKGAAPAVVVRKLVAEGIVKHEWPLRLYLKFTGAGAGVKAGDYDFPSPISPLGALAKIQQGQQRMTKITIIEGWTRWDIA